MTEHDDEREERLSRAMEEHEYREEQKPIKIKMNKKVGLILLIIGFAAFMIIQYGLKGLNPTDVMDSIGGITP